MQRWSSWSVQIGALGISLIVAALLLGLLTAIRRELLLLLAGIGVIAIAFYLLNRPRATRRMDYARITLQGANVIVMAVAFVGIIAALNFIVERQFRQRLDVTANRAHTLSDQTLKVLKQLDAPIQVTGFFTPQYQARREEAEQQLKNYLAHTDKLQVRWLDPDANPAAAREYDNALPYTLVFEKGSRREKVYTFDENTFTNAILKVTQTTQPAIYFTSGHGEYDINDYDVNGLSTIVDLLKQVNYKVEPLNLAAITDTLPADTRAIVIAGATKKFSPEDEKRLSDYLAKGGRLWILLDPNTDIGLSGLLQNWGLVPQKDLVLDPGLNYRGQVPVPAFLQFPSSPVTENLEGMVVFFPGVSSIKKQGGDDKFITALFTTSDQSCAKTDFKALEAQTVLRCDEQDPKGPFVVGYTVEVETGRRPVPTSAGGADSDLRARVVVIGNAAFLTNRWMNNPDSLGNQQLVSNIANWLAGQEELISIPPRPLDQRPLAALTESDLNIILWTSVALIPLAALTVGGLMWWRRR